MPQVSQSAIFLGRNLSCDEQTIGFQGNHRDKQRITYKKKVMVFWQIAFAAMNTLMLFGSDTMKQAK